MSFGTCFSIGQPLKVIDLTYSVWETLLGDYFFGQTEPLNFGNKLNAWGALINPPDSSVDMFWNVFTLSNFSSQPFTAEIWLNSTTPGNGNLSENVTSANQALNPVPKPKIELKYGDGTIKPPFGGIYSFTRIVEPNYTLTRHDFQGMIIIPPGGSAITYLKSPDKGKVQSVAAFGWWEQDCKKSRKLPVNIRRK